MLIIGLTGGIGSGKSTASQYFEKLGVPVIDADTLTRELVAPGQPALKAISDQLGNDLLTIEGELDRAQLRRRIFANPEQRHILEAILHPRAHDAALQQLATLRESAKPPTYVILSAALLIESSWTDMVDRVLVVDATPEQQRQRASQRDGLSAEQIDAIMQSQVDRDTRIKAADDVIHNNSDLPALQKQIDALHPQYLQLAHPA